MIRKICLKFIGGLGKNIAGTAICRQIKAQYPDCVLHVLASFPDVFVGLPFVDRVYPFMNAPMPDFYDYHRDFDMWEAEPYADLQYRLGNQHIVDVWCRKLGLNLPDNRCGTLALHEGSEVEWAKRSIQSMNLGKTPVVAFQPFGGTPFTDANQAGDVMRPKQARDLPVETANTIATKLNQAGIAVVQISLPTEPQLQTTLKIQLPQGQVMQPRLLFALLAQVHGLVAIDSFAQHAWASLKREGAVVLWGATNPANLGYSANTNLSRKSACSTPHCNRPDPHMMDCMGNGQPWRCPHKSVCMNYDADEVVQAVRAVIQPATKEPETSPVPA